MSREDVLNEFGRLVNPKTRKDEADAFKVVLDIGERVTRELDGHPWGTAMEQEGHLLLRLILTRGQSIRRLMNEAPLTNSIDGVEYGVALDPLSIETLVRAQFEAFCIAHHIYVRPATVAERELRYLLWVLAGFAKRQQMAKILTYPILIQKASTEKLEMERIEERVQKNRYYVALTHEDKRIVDSVIKKKEYLVIRKDNRLYAGKWFDLFREAVPKKEFDHSYTMLSQASHPSHISVYQFRDMYSTGEFKSMAWFALQTSGMLMAFAIRDYIGRHRAADVVFNTLSHPHQMLLNQLNVMFRGRRFRLNEILLDYGFDTVRIPGFVRLKPRF